MRIPWRTPAILSACAGPSLVLGVGASAALFAQDPASPPSWYRSLPAERRAELPLPEGLAFGDQEGEYVNEKDGSILVWVPAGSFRMGGDDPTRDTFPVHRVTFERGSFLGKYEVTWAQYHRFCRATGREPADPGGVSGDDVPMEGRHPVEVEAWSHAAAYCEWAGLRLPSEAEWEYAARGDDGRTYPWGEEPPDRTRGNFAPPRHERDEGQRDGFPSTAPVGSFPGGVSPFGCHDMAGNVTELVQDHYHRQYEGAPSDGSAWLDVGAEGRDRAGTIRGLDEEGRVEERPPDRVYRDTVHVERYRAIVRGWFQVWKRAFHGFRVAR